MGGDGRDLVKARMDRTDYDVELAQKFVVHIEVAVGPDINLDASQNSRRAMGGIPLLNFGDLPAYFFGVLAAGYAQPLGVVGDCHIAISQIFLFLPHSTEVGR